jgi:hypothetical protein
MSDDAVSKRRLSREQFEALLHDVREGALYRPR